MKLFSSFDTDFKKKIIDEEVKRFGKDKVYVISHGKFYYYFYIIIPAILTIVGFVIYYSLLYYISKDLDSDLRSVVKIIGYTVNIIVFIPLFLKLIKKYIDYILDFVVVTPKNLIAYNQEGLFTRKGRTVDVEKIKTITVNKDGLLRSLFNFGSIIILTEGDEQGAGEINFSFIDDPDNVKFKVLEIINSEE